MRHKVYSLACTLACKKLKQHKGCKVEGCRCPCHNLELYISPDLKLRLGLPQKTTTEYLEKQKP